MKKIGIEKTDIFDIIKAILLSILFSMIFVLLFAFIVRFSGIKAEWVMPINQVIKVLSIFLGSLIGIKNPSKGVLKGICIGLLFLLISYLIFSAFSGGFKENSLTIYDFLTCIGAGTVSGIFAVNLKNK